MTTTETPPSSIELAATRLLWREQLRSLPRSLRHALARLFRREVRMHLVDDATGTVLARFTSEEDCARFTEWLGHTHNWSFEMGREFVVAQHLSLDALHDRTP